jgi:hypothetical protein
MHANHAFCTKQKTTQQWDDGECTMMVHCRRRIGFHGHQAMESTRNLLMEDDGGAFLLCFICVFFMFVSF